MDKSLIFCALFNLSAATYYYFNNYLFIVGPFLVFAISLFIIIGLARITK